MRFTTHLWIFMVSSRSELGMVASFIYRMTHGLTQVSRSCATDNTQNGDIDMVLKNAFLESPQNGYCYCNPHVWIYERQWISISSQSPDPWGPRRLPTDLHSACQIGRPDAGHHGMWHRFNELWRWDESKSPNIGSIMGYSKKVDHNGIFQSNMWYSKKCRSQWG